LPGWTGAEPEKSMRAAGSPPPISIATAIGEPSSRRSAAA
jgi:hypothetical protein